MIGALFLLSLRQAASPRRLLLLGAISLFPVGLAYLLVRLGEADQAGLVEAVVEGLVVSLVLPLVTMVLATGAFGNEVEDRTLSLLTTKPVPRWSLVLSKLMSTIVVAGPIMVIVAVVVTALPPDREGGVIVAAAVGAAVAVVVYASVFTWAGLVTTKALAFGLVYVLLWEALITDLPERDALPQHPQLHDRRDARDGGKPVQRGPGHRVHDGRRRGSGGHRRLLRARGAAAEPDGRAVGGAGRAE